MKNLGIVIPSLNSAKTIIDTLESLVPLIAQGSVVILADSYSTDGTRDIASRYRVEVIEVPPGNMYEAVNAGLQSLDCEWLTYINSDDRLHADTVSRMLKSAADFDVVYGNLDFVDFTGRFYGHWNTMKPEELISGYRAGIMPHLQAGTLFRREVFSNLGGFNTKYMYSSDFDFFLRSLKAGYRFGRFSFPPVASFRRSATQISARHATEMREEVWESIACNRLGCPTIYDNAIILKWRFRNLKNYLIRWARSEDLSGRWKLVKSL